MSSSLARKHSLHSLIMFALPNMVMMIFMSLYVIVDGMFISRFVGTDALSATNMVYPAQSIEMATAIMVATGGSAIIARKLGEGKPDEAKGDLSFLVLVETVLGILTAIAAHPVLVRSVFLPANSVSGVFYNSRKTRTRPYCDCCRRSRQCSA